MHVHNSSDCEIKAIAFLLCGEGKTDIILKYGRVRNEWILVWELISI